MPKKILITGCASKVGREISLYLASLGYHIIGHCHSSKEAAELICRKITSSGGECNIIQSDLTRDKEIKALVPQVNKDFGKLHGLINNASIFIPDTLMGADAKAWDRHSAIHIKAPLLLSQAMCHQHQGEEPGWVINISDQMAENFNSRYATYSLSKSALNTLTKAMAKEFAPKIRVNALALGLVGGSNMEDEAFNNLVNNTPLICFTTYKEITASISLLVNSPSMTGNILALDSGMSVK